MKYRSANIDEKEMLFGKWCSMPGVWTLTNRWQNFMFLIVGEEKAMLIDTGYGEGNLREIVEGITDKPVMVVDTHGHFDHIGAVDAVCEKYGVPVYIHEADAIKLTDTEANTGAKFGHPVTVRT